MKSALRRAQTLLPDDTDVQLNELIQVPVNHHQPIAYVSDLPRFAAALRDCRAAHPLPAEQPISVDQLTRLAARIMPIQNAKSVRQMADTLTLRERKLLIPLVAALETRSIPAKTVPTAKIRPLISKARRLIRAKPAPSLYETGWNILQQSYPAPATAAALGDLCRGLPRHHQIDADSISQLPPRSQYDPIRRRIDEIIKPGASKFLPRLSAILARQDLPVDRFFEAYSINPEQPLGADLIGQCFLNSDSDFFRAGYEQFNRALPYMSPSYQMQLVRHLFSQNDLDAKLRNSCYQTVFRLFGDPDRTFAGQDRRHPIWKQISRAKSADYRTWIIAATIGTQCHYSRRKAGFYLRYLDDIRTAERDAENMMTVYFQHFMLQDDPRYPDLIYFQANQFRASAPDASPIGTISVSEALERVHSRRSRRTSIPAVVVLDLATAVGQDDSHTWVQMHLNRRGPAFR